MGGFQIGYEYFSQEPSRKMVRGKVVGRSGALSKNSQFLVAVRGYPRESHAGALPRL